MSPVDLRGVRRERAALAELDALAGQVRPMTDDELVEVRVGATKTTSVRLLPAQEAELDRLAEVLQRTRPELALLAREGTLSRYTVLRIAIDRGLRELARDVARDAEGGDRE